MRRAPSFHNRIFPSRSLPMTEYSVEDLRILLTNSTACCVLARIELSKSPGFIAASCQTVARQWGNKSSQPSSHTPTAIVRAKNITVTGALGGSLNERTNYLLFLQPIPIREGRR